MSSATISLPTKYVDSFWSRVDRDGPELRHGQGNCWIWTGATDSDGYGVMTVRAPHKLLIKTHRLSFFIFTGRWPTPCCLHVCDNQRCVRPSHLFEGTVLDNVLDRHAKGRSKAFAPKLSRSQVLYVRSMLDSGVPISTVAKALGVSTGCINGIKTGASWAYL